MDHAAASRAVTELWNGPVLTQLSELVAIPAVSQVFDPDWAANGHLAAAVELLRSWATDRALPGASVEVVSLPGCSPVLVIDIPATERAQPGTVLLYGHLDKQPPVGGWSEGLGPWTPVLRNGRLYGRGAADDGYAGFAAITAIEALRRSGGEHARCVLLLETGEESGSPDLGAYLAHLRDRLGEVSLVVCLDSGGNDYGRMWLTTSLRGLVQLRVTARVLRIGQHSGVASGVVTSSFRVLRQLLDRLEDSATGEIQLPELKVPIPPHRIADVKDAVATVPGVLANELPRLPGVALVNEDDEVELTLNQTWRPTLSVIGADGLPAPENAGNVLRPFTTLCLSFRLPPTTDSAAALAAIQRALTADVPDGAHIELSGADNADGWHAAELAPWLRNALDEASSRVFGAPWRSIGSGGSIPFMGLLQASYPSAQFVVTGVLGPDSNAHVPDESIHLDYAAKITEAVALVLDAHARRAG